MSGGPISLECALGLTKIDGEGAYRVGHREEAIASNGGPIRAGLLAGQGQPRSSPEILHRESTPVEWSRYQKRGGAIFQTYLRAPRDFPEKCACR